MCTRGKCYLHSSLVLLALTGSPQRHAQQWMYLCINTPGKSLASLLSLLAHFSAGEPPPGEWGSFWWAGSIRALGGFQKRIHSSPTAAARKNGAQTWIHVHVLNTQQKGAGPWGKGTAELQVVAHGPALAAWPQPGGKHPTSGHLLAHHAIKKIMLLLDWISQQIKQDFVLWIIKPHPLWKCSAFQPNASCLNSLWGKWSSTAKAPISHTC